MTPKQKAMHDQAERERKIVRDWLAGLMAQSPNKPATKTELCAIAVDKFGVSKSSFNVGWDWAISTPGMIVGTSRISTHSGRQHLPGINTLQKIFPLRFLVRVFVGYSFPSAR
jgi:hypothetical protein